ncbi:metallophosphoesterase [Levilactobacillus acidifarinae]|uniref:Calcineurin-like phosphoesterase domain-containing protein n=1 Tax=Levilactobacillus acidifarinae DSM 19394 = JCM 15949 TaxID=1423715 RepID=A0A0R1LLG5_9LACO|nr:metallophosphoesterase [Levilactobacillus acidifarinae]KRK96693.1 hypothetical protein FD25_GL001772 [Levilactobacillus acidifarinae DSM 19394]GEO70390.1 serine/threonine protein phosphatase [Levilactobacillus acidifarinae]
MTKITFVGDIHSAADDLRALLRDPVIRKNQIIFVGDYIDGQAKRRFSDHTETNRLDPLGVLDILMARVARGDVALLGNHDELWVETARQNADDYLLWQHKSGHQLADQLGIHATKLAAVAAALNRKPLRKYTEFLANLPLTWENAHLFAVHAGLNWHRALDRQRPEDLLDIRGPYFYQNTTKDKWHANQLGKIIITGHTPVQKLTGTGVGYLKMQANAHDVPRYLINAGSRSKHFDGGISALTLTATGQFVQEKRAIKGHLYDGNQRVTEKMIRN